MELDLQSYLGSCVQLYSLAEAPQLPPSPCIWAHIRGLYWSAKIDDISLYPPDIKEQYKTTGPMYSVFCRPYPFSPQPPTTVFGSYLSCLY
jgi:hypothetical protein